MKRLAGARHGNAETFRSRLVDHIQFVVKDLQASHRFYGPGLGTLGIPVDFEMDGMFGADELAYQLRLLMAHREGWQVRLIPHFRRAMKPWFKPFTMPALPPARITTERQV